MSVFKNHIISLSFAKSYSDIMKNDEWLYINDKKFDDKCGKCICKQKIKHAYYFINSITGHGICLGKDCMKKLKFRSRP